MTLLKKLARLQASVGRRLSVGNSWSSPVRPRRPIEKLLIANRGEIACRVARTARRLGVRVVAIFSEADRQAMHVASADDSYLVGPPPSSESYLNQDKILEIVERSGADAVHPGYGFLSENAAFADRLQTNGICWVGPPSSAIRDMGVKSTAKRIMTDADVPVVPGYHGSSQEDELLASEAERIGFPVLIKATHGGGGKGMRIVRQADQFAEALNSCRNESLKAFGDDSVILEKYVDDPRHIEVQIFGDQLGNYVHLWERDCSVQRRHQKVLEESPAPGLSSEQRQRLGEIAVRAAAAVGYVGAGTVEFLMDPRAAAAHSGAGFYFMEMNTRLQVEHPVTELVTGVDLVEWQLRVAQGEPIPLSQEAIPCRGSAVEARIYAENPDNSFLPAPGPLHFLQYPPNSVSSSFSAAQTRTDTGVRQGDQISVFYDPMIAKLICWAPDRRQSLRHLNNALAEFHVCGTQSNVQFLRRILAQSDFQNGAVDTGFIERHSKTILPSAESFVSLRPDLVALGCLAQNLLSRASHSKVRRFIAQSTSSSPNSPWSSCHSFRVNASPVINETLRFAFSGQMDFSPIETSIYPDGDSYRVVVTVIPPDEDQSKGIRIEKKFQNVSLYPVSLEGHYKSVFELGVSCMDAENFAKSENLSSRLFCEVNTSDIAKDRFNIDIFDVDPSFSASSNCHLTFQNGPLTYSSADGSESAGLDQGGSVSPMPGVVERVQVAEGASVKRGDALVVIVAMKMEYIVRAGRDGTVRKLCCSPGSHVDKGQLLVEIE